MKQNERTHKKHGKINLLKKTRQPNHTNEITKCQTITKRKTEKLETQV